MTTIGILGTGHLADFLIRGAAPHGYRFIVSPSRRAASLVGDHVTLAPSNQTVLDRADLIVVALPARDGLSILQTLRFRPEHSVLSAMAGTRLQPLSQAVAPARARCTMMPGHANAYGVGPSLLYPPDPAWNDFLATLGPVHSFTDEAPFVTATAFGALSGASFFLIETLADWFTRNGLPEAEARRLIAETLIGNATVVLREDLPLAAITPGVATRGGITEALVAGLREADALDAWHAALDGVLDRLRGV